MVRGYICTHKNKNHTRGVVGLNINKMSRKRCIWCFGIFETSGSNKQMKMTYTLNSLLTMHASTSMHQTEGSSSSFTVLLRTYGICGPSTDINIRWRVWSGVRRQRLSLGIRFSVENDLSTVAAPTVV